VLPLITVNKVLCVYGTGLNRYLA